MGNERTPLRSDNGLQRRTTRIVSSIWSRSILIVVASGSVLMENLLVSMAAAKRLADAVVRRQQKCPSRNPCGEA